MLRTRAVLRPGISASRSRRSCVWVPKAGSPERCWMRAAGPARMHFTSPLSDCRSWVLTWRGTPWRSRETRRGIEIEFAAADAFQLERLKRRFKTVLDCGLFHTFDRDEQPVYVASLASVIERDGTLYVLCFSDDGLDAGPHPVTQEQLRAAFRPGDGWQVVSIQPERIQTRFHESGAPAWLATIRRPNYARLSYRYR